MEARGALSGERTRRLPTWLLGAVPLLIVIAGIVLLAALNGPGLGDRNGVPVEQLAVERTVLRPGEIELTVRNDGPDPVVISQVSVNDGYVDFAQSRDEIGRLESVELTVPYEWIEGENYEVVMLTETGGTIDHAIEAAAETPSNDAGFFGLMALLGLYVGIIPVTVGMLWLPFVRRLSREWIRIVLAFTVGLLAFLAVDALLEGSEVAGEGAQAFGGTALVIMGAMLAYIALAGVDGYIRRRRQRAEEGGAGGFQASYVPLLVAIGIGLHNLGEGLAIGSAYAIGALALGAFLVIGFAIHNTTEGLAIVAPIGSQPVSWPRLAGLGLIAGAPAILGTWIGAASFNASLTAFMLGLGVGAIVAVIQQLVPGVRDADGRIFYPESAIAIAAGIGALYLTSLLVSV
jgi:zinc transporter ZupT